MRFATYTYTHTHTQPETKAEVLYTNEATPISHKPMEYEAPISPNPPNTDKRYVSAPKLDQIEEESTLKLSTAQRLGFPSKGTFPKQTDMPIDNGYVLAEEVEEPKDVSGYEYLDQEGQKIITSVSSRLRIYNYMYCHVSFNCGYTA